MQSYSSVKNATNQTLAALQEEVDNSFNKTRRKAEELAERHDRIIKRQKLFTEGNGGYLVSDDDIIKINVGGTIQSVRRETLTLIKGSRLEVLFSGRWENRILRDEDGHVFLDVDPISFKKIIDYLYMIKLSSSLSGNASQVKLPTGKDKIIDIYVNFFGLADELNYANSSSLSNDGKEIAAGSQKKISVYDKLFDCIEKEEKTLVKLENDLDKCEKYMGEETYVSCFTTRIDEEVEEDDDFTMINDENNNLSTNSYSAPSLKREDANSTLNLYLGGEIMTVRRSTLCLYKDSVLARQFANNDWIKAQTITLENGKAAVLIEQPISSFRKMINQLRLRAMLKPDMEYYCKKDSNEAPMLKQLATLYFPANESVILGDYLSFDSEIIDSEYSAQIMSWLEEVEKSPEPQLLYRASRDGWDIQEFRSRCHNNGATVTVAKTKEGYVVGGYSDKSFNSKHYFVSSNDAFLFSLKCHAGLPPFKMALRPNMKHHAVLGGTFHGAYFGSAGDLCIGNSTSMKHGNYDLGSGSYHLPDFAEDTFLTGDDDLTLEFEEVEVFAV